MKNLTQVALVGAGNMGGGMLARLLGLGWSVAVHDIDPQVQSQAVALGAVACGSALEAARMLAPDGVLMVVVVDAAQTEAVLWGEGGAGPVMKPGQSVMLCPTLGPATVQSQAERLAPMGVDFIDAPMSGGPVRAQQGTMSLMVACSDAVWQRSQKLLTALSQQVFRVGTRAGDGARTKLVNNLAAAINLVGAAEVLVLAQKMGLDLARTLDVIEQSSGQSWIGSDRMRRAIAGDYAPRAHLSLLQKDTRLAVEAAQAVGFAGPLGAHVRDVFASASVAGLAGFDDAALFDWLARSRDGLQGL